MAAYGCSLLQKFTFGNGALAFYQFSNPYGQPGPLDNLYFRVASEVGIVGGLILSSLFFRAIYRSAKSNNNTKICYSYMVAISVISIFQESLLTPRAGHILAILGVYLMHKDFSNYECQKNISDGNM